MEEPWSNEKVLELISIYEKYPDLWDSKHQSYYAKRKRNESWQKIADHFDTDLANVKRKMCSLLGSFRAQKSKGKKYIGEGPSMKEVYVSKWFAFESMMFLLDQKEPQNSIAGDESDETFETVEIKYENDSDIELMEPTCLANNMNENIDISEHSKTENLNLNKTEESLPVDVTIAVDNDVNSKENPDSAAKLNLNYFDSEYGIHFTHTDLANSPNYNCSSPEKETNSRKRKIKENCKNSQKIVPTEQTSNNCGAVPDQNKVSDSNATTISNNINIFGQYLACKLRGYSSKTRAIAENAINNILFEADMGWYENVELQPKVRSSYS